MNTNIEVLRELDELVEAARLLGVTQAKKGFGCHTDEDRRFERAMYESIDKHRAALLDWKAKQPVTVDEAIDKARFDSYDLAHEIWAVAQLAPGEGIADAVERIAALLAIHTQHQEEGK